MGDGGELERARAGWRIKRYDNVAKSELRQIFAKIAKILRLSQKYSKTNPAKLKKKTFRPHFVFVWFRESDGFRDSREYS